MSPLQLSFRKLTDQELTALMNQGGSSSLVVQLLVDGLKDLQPFEGTSVGPFESENRAKNTAPLLSEVAKQLKWGEGHLTASGRRKPCTKWKAVADQNGIWHLHIVRIL